MSTASSPKMLSPKKKTPWTTCITNSPACLPASTTLASSSSLGEIRAWRKLRRDARAAARQQSTQLVKYVLLLEKTLCRIELTLPASFTLLQSRRRSHISRYIEWRSFERGSHFIYITFRLIFLEKSRKSPKCAVTWIIYLTGLSVTEKTGPSVCLRRSTPR